MLCDPTYLLKYVLCVYLKTYILYLHFTFHSTFKSMSILNPSILLLPRVSLLAAFPSNSLPLPLLLFSTFFSFLWQLCILFFWYSQNFSLFLWLSSYNFFYLISSFQLYACQWDADVRHAMITITIYVLALYSSSTTLHKSYINTGHIVEDWDILTGM